MNTRLHYRCHILPRLDASSKDEEFVLLKKEECGMPTTGRQGCGFYTYRLQAYYSYSLQHQIVHLAKHLAFFLRKVNAAGEILKFSLN